MSDHHNIFQHFLSTPFGFKRLPTELKEALFKRFFDILIPSVALLSLFGGIITAFPVFYSNRVIVGVLGLSAMASVYLAKKYLLYTQTMHLFMILCALILTYTTLCNGGVRAPTFIAFGNLLIIMGCLYDMRINYIAFFGILVLSLFSHYLMEFNLLPRPELPPNAVYIMIYSLLC